ncbi:MAG TPA: DUF2939 domain-containing protein [Allosphingosinicella sp.]|nr:DUF2939 domain-containing protein [Allosphingosinicella sp.]
MRKSRTIALAAAALLALLASGWWFGSPWWTLWRMRKAAQSGDSEALAGYIDFPALRASTRAQLAPRLGPLGNAFAGPAVDALVSPSALRLALGSGRGAGRGGGKPAGIALVRSGAGEFRSSAKTAASSSAATALAGSWKKFV